MVPQGDHMGRTEALRQRCLKQPLDVSTLLRSFAHCPSRDRYFLDGEDIYLDLYPLCVSGHMVAEMFECYALYIPWKPVAQPIVTCEFWEAPFSISMPCTYWPREETMPIRFRRTFKILPGVKINVSKHGMSVTIGPRGFHLTFNRFGIRQTVGLPGSGLSETSYLVGGDRETKAAEHEGQDDIHHGEGRGCEMSGCGCFVVMLLIAGVLVYFGADAMRLHPASIISTFLTQLWHTLTQWIR
jgi:uncharacterized protein DUF4236